MRSILCFPILLTLVAGPALGSDDVECSARAAAVVDRMRADAGGSLSEREADIARAAAFAACSGRSSAPEPKDEAAGSATALQRFWAGLVSLENRPVRKRAGKYRYVEK